MVIKDKHTDENPTQRSGAHVRRDDDWRTHINEHLRDEAKRLGTQVKHLTGQVTYLTTENKALTGLLRTNSKEVERLTKLLEHTRTDQLTGLGTRRALHAEFPKLLNIAVRNKKDLALVIIDLDGLKEINDTLGHIEGDNMIKAAASSIKETLRVEDFGYKLGGGFRWSEGGDEFVILAIVNDRQGTEKMLERLEKKMASHGVKYASGFSMMSKFLTKDTKIGSESSNNVMNHMFEEADAIMYTRKGTKRARRE